MMIRSFPARLSSKPKVFRMAPYPKGHRSLPSPRLIFAAGSESDDRGSRQGRISASSPGMSVADHHVLSKTVSHLPERGGEFESFQSLAQAIDHREFIGADRSWRRRRSGNVPATQDGTAQCIVRNTGEARTTYSRRMLTVAAAERNYRLRRNVR